MEQIYRASASPWRIKKRAMPAVEYKKKQQQQYFRQQRWRIGLSSQRPRCRRCTGKLFILWRRDFVSPLDPPPASSHRSAADDYLDGCWHLHKAAQCVCGVFVYTLKLTFNTLATSRDDSSPTAAASNAFYYLLLLFNYILQLTAQVCRKEKKKKKPWGWGRRPSRGFLTFSYCHFFSLHGIIHY